MITAAAEVAHQLATTSETHRARMTNVALSSLDERLRTERTYVVPGAASASLWALREEIRVATEALERLEVLA